MSRRESAPRWDSTILKWRYRLVAFGWIALCFCPFISGQEPPQRPFLMGFSTWSYGPRETHVRQTYEFVFEHGDIYSEQIDDTIPWRAALEQTDYPANFVAGIQQKRARRAKSKKLLLSISSLNMERSGMAEAYQADMPSELRTKKLSDPRWIAAYTRYCRWLVEQFEPDYLIVGMEVNELLNHDPQRWPEYIVFSRAVRKALKETYPDLKVSESVTLHKLLNPETSDDEQYRRTIKEFVNELDFVSISYHPLFLLRTRGHQFRSDLRYLRKFAGDKPVAISETSCHAVPLEVQEWNYKLRASQSTQSQFIHELLSEAEQRRFLFVIYFTHRDYHLLWKTFPDEIKLIGRMWRDTGLVDQHGNPRPAFKTWQQWLQR